MCDTKYDQPECLEFAHHPGPAAPFDESSRSIRCQKCGDWALAGSRFYTIH
ncbi:uncharacterized protein N7498_001666 [Penicillium cinerascens]|uniref:Uncharacterized protein n=1 Tax=Penicillium cinerascens TaxID=70096 RepID=A0A9W9NA96_9EURO|nr:uncharacterized protein N7498_001666 [Penicillium cinerascens]KAJ5215259.1 hypothetical protein N7498_001666 [Penicillium cinerascens]